MRAAESKKATDIRVLDLSGITAFADFFVICTGANARNVQAIADEVGLRLKQAGELPFCVEGYNQAEWVLSDYGDVVVHTLTPKARSYYDLERLWREGKPVEFAGEGNGPLAALVHGFSQAGVPRFEIAAYSEHALGAGEEASAIAYIQIKHSDGKTRWGAGVDTNIELASVRAVLSALNRS